MSLPIRSEASRAAPGSYVRRHVPRTRHRPPWRHGSGVSRLHCHLGLGARAIPRRGVGLNFLRSSSMAALSSTFSTVFYRLLTSEK